MSQISLCVVVVIGGPSSPAADRSGPETRKLPTMRRGAATTSHRVSGIFLLSGLLSDRHRDRIRVPRADITVCGVRSRISTCRALALKQCCGGRASSATSSTRCRHENQLGCSKVGVAVLVVLAINELARTPRAVGSDSGPNPRSCVA